MPEHRDTKVSVQELRKKLDGAVIVAVVSGNIHQGRKADFEVGISILDLRDTTNGIKTHHFVTEAAEFCSRVAKRCYLGDTKQIGADKLEASIKVGTSIVIGGRGSDQSCV